MTVPSSVLVCLLATALSVAGRPSFQPDIVWPEGAPPTLRLTFTGALSLPEEGVVPTMSCVLTQAGRAQPLWQGPIKLPLGEPPYVIEQPLSQLKETGKQHTVELVLDGELGIVQSETLSFAGPEAPVRNYGVRRCGKYPDETVFLTLSLSGIKRPQEVPCTIAVRDRTETVVDNREVRLPLGLTDSHHAIAVTPDTAASLGPYRLEFTLDNPDVNLYASATLDFGFANVCVPVADFEDADPALWFAVESKENPFSARSGAYYYSSQLSSLIPAADPLISFVTDVTHSGERALQVDYARTGIATVWSRVALPGNPVHFVLWVKGDGSGDQLVVHFQDHINDSLQAWIRNADFSRAGVCRLDFEDWRQFRVPVLGLGLQQASKKGSTENIDAPISILAFSIVPARKQDSAERGRVWLDGLQVETQAEPGEQLLLELHADDPHCRLSHSNRLEIALGNGSGTALPSVQLTVTATAAGGAAAFSQRLELAAPAAAVTTTSVDLAALRQASPAGPIDIDVTAAVSDRPGLRTKQRLTLANAQHTALWQDFEAEATFSAYAPGKVMPGPNQSIVPGGIDGGHALALAIDPEREDNSILFHPSLPGFAARVELMVKGTGESLTVQPWFIDSSYSGIWLLPYNLFWAEPVTIAGENWQRLTIQAPPVPAGYGDDSRYFFRRPWYPLNLALGFTAKAAGTVLLDDVRVVTHLPVDAPTVVGEVVYPDETHVLPPDAPLIIRLTNYGASPATPAVSCRLRSYQGYMAADVTRELDLPAGSRQTFELLDHVPAGVYSLELTGFGSGPLQSELIILPPAYFGDDPETFVADLPSMRRSIGLVTEKIYMDWDNTEPVPNLYHYAWFNAVAETASAAGAYELLPVIGFSSDWAGPEAQESIRRLEYFRSFPNYLQVPVSTLNWSLFVRECLREYQSRFAAYTFWENPDLKDSPQGIPPARYPELLAEVWRWVHRYQPDAKVIAGGFNFHQILDYLDKIPDRERLTFDEIAVQMNLGELSPEAAELEAFLDDLDATLQLRANGRRMRASELDWSIGDYLTPLQQAAYHARASLILDSRGVRPHQFAIINAGFAYQGFGVVYRAAWGNSPELQTFKPYHLPKPSYFALRRVQSFLAENEFVASVDLPHRDLGAARAFVYRSKNGLTAVMWQASGAPRTYLRPAAWGETVGRDVFDIAAHERQLTCGELPFFYALPGAYETAQLLHDLRHLEPADGQSRTVLSFLTADADSCRQARYVVTGTTTMVEHAGRVPGGRRVRQLFATGIERERFVFSLAEPANVLLTRCWYFDGKGNGLQIQLDEQDPQSWDLTAGKDNRPGIRQSTWYFGHCNSGDHAVSVSYAQPGNCSGYRIELLPDGPIPLSRWGMLHAPQTVGEVSRYRNAVGLPLQISRQLYDDGLGVHATSLIEYPLDGRFTRFAAKVGIDSQTEGRGSVVFRVYADGREVAASPLMNGLDSALALEVNDLDDVRRLLLSVTDGGDGGNHDLADWVEATLEAK